MTVIDKLIEYMNHYHYKNLEEIYNVDVHKEKMDQIIDSYVLEVEHGRD